MTAKPLLSSDTILAVLAERDGARACLEAAAVAAPALKHPCITGLHVRVEPIRERVPTEEILTPARVGFGFCVGLDGPGGSKQLRNLDQRRRCPTPLFDGSLIAPVLILQPQRADPADIIHGQEIVHGVERPGINRMAGAARLLPALGMITLDDASRRGSTMSPSAAAKPRANRAIA